MAFQDAGTLSGGEKTKLALAQLVAGRHNLLLLDEPTNNLDPPSREAIGQALSSWPGAMVLVSHDTGFVSELAPDEVLLMPDGTVDALERRPARAGGDGLTDAAPGPARNLLAATGRSGRPPRRRQGR